MKPVKTITDQVKFIPRAIVWLLSFCLWLGSTGSSCAEVRGAATYAPGVGIQSKQVERKQAAVPEPTTHTAEPPQQSTVPSTTTTPSPSEHLAELVLPEEQKQAVALQIFLDQKNFGPGFIDGNPGQFTRLAIAHYNESLGRDRNDPRVIAESLAEVDDVFATAIIPAVAEKYVDPSLPTERPLQAERKSMPYRSYAELMAERYHTSVDLLTELNGQKRVQSARVRSALIVPNVDPFLIESMKHGRTHKRDKSLSARHVVVDTAIKQVLIYALEIEASGNESAARPQQAKPRLIASFPITPGKSRFIPKGYWNLKNSIELPEWRFDQQLLDTGVRGTKSLSIPPGPNNPIGVIWNGLTKSGIGIHGTNNPRTIGRARSAGCIRLANWDAARIPQLVRPGVVVVIR